MCSRRRALTATLGLVAAAVLLALALQTGTGRSSAQSGQSGGNTCLGGELRQALTEDFSAFDASQWTLGGSAEWDSSAEKFYLTRAQPNQAGRLFYGTKLIGCGFRAEFDIDISGGNGADGMTFAVVQHTDYDPGIGGGLDFCPEDGGFAVKFDTYLNAGEPAGEHVGVIQDCAGNLLASALVAVRGQHHVIVDFVQGTVDVTFDGSPVLNYTFPDITYFEGFVGFTGATGGLNDDHIVDNFTLGIANPRQGDLDCNGNIDSHDGLIGLLFLQELNYGADERPLCPHPDFPVIEFEFADVNCDGVVDAQDILAIIAFAGHVAFTAPDGCTPIGEPL